VSSRLYIYEHRSNPRHSDNLTVPVLSSNSNYSVTCKESPNKSLKVGLIWCHKNKIMVDANLDVNPACLTDFDNLKFQHGYQGLIFKVHDQREIVVDHHVPLNASFSDLKQALPRNEPRFAIFDYHFLSNDGHPREKLIFVHWNPDASSVGSRMLYASSKENLKKRLSGIAKEFQATDDSDLNEEGITRILREV
jgi:cofilin